MYGYSNNKRGKTKSPTKMPTNKDCPHRRVPSPLRQAMGSTNKQAITKTKNKNKNETEKQK